MIRFHPENPHAHIYTHTHIFISFISIRVEKRRKKNEWRTTKKKRPTVIIERKRERERGERLLSTWDKILFYCVCVWWGINISWERHEERRVINEMRRRTTHEILWNGKCRRQNAWYKKCKISWPVLVIVIKSRSNAIFEIIMKAGSTSVGSVSYP